MTKNSDQIAADLAQFVQGEVHGDFIHRAACSIDASIYRVLPQCVVVPLGAEDVQAVMRYCTEEAIPVAPRGAASGLAGESLCSGVVLDMSRMRRIVDSPAKGGRVTCEPGVVLEEVNRFLAKQGQMIGPDPSSANRATIGGSVANNATGAHSLQYGHMADHVWAMEAVLSDGTRMVLRNGVRPDHAASDRPSSLAGRCLEILSQNATTISQAVPKARRARIGYQVQGVWGDGRVDMARLLAGSEGTLAVFTEISVNTVPLPPAKALLELEFESLQAMAEAVPLIVETGPTACELMDRTLMDMAVAALPQYRDLFPTGAAAVLLVEQVGGDVKQALEGLQRTDKAVGRVACGRRTVSDPIEQRRLWKSRTDAVPLLYRRKGYKQPIPFIEDTCVEHTQLGRYIVGLQQIGHRYGVTLCYYGHAGDGELHVRPYLDLGSADDLRTMKAMADEVFALVWSLGGSISGEHAYGLVRAGFVRRQFGDAYVDVLGQIKQAFDPRGLLNPGKVINDDPGVMTANLRRSHALIPQRTHSDLHFGPEELALEIVQCNGCGLCRSHSNEQRMCPVFHALGEELASPRCKVNLLDLWVTGQMDAALFQSAQFAQVLDLCIHCKACSRQCPSGVDVSKLMMAAKSEWVRSNGVRTPEFALANNRHLAALAGLFAPAANAVMASSPFRLALEKGIGLDRLRRMPPFKAGSFLRTARLYLERCGPVARPIDSVVYLPDAFVTTYDHGLGLSVLKVLRANGIHVELPLHRPVPLPAMNYGYVRLARSDFSYLVNGLAPWVKKGFKVICSEPSAAMGLIQDLRHFVDTQDAQRVSQSTMELMNYLLTLHKAGTLKLPQNRPAGEYVYHEPCHLAAMTDAQAGVQLVRDLCGARVTNLKAGCCGLAGTYGMQRANRALTGRMSERLKEALLSRQAETVLTECSACSMQITQIGGSDVQRAHPVQILADAYLDPSEGP